MEMLHHPWIRTYQRRTSVVMPQILRCVLRGVQGLGRCWVQTQGPAVCACCCPRQRKGLQCVSRVGTFSDLAYKI
jgi:hypothetical protein